MPFIFWFILITSPVLYCADHENQEPLPPVSVMTKAEYTHPEYLSDMSIIKHPVVPDESHEPLAPLEDLLKELLGKYKDVLLRGEVDEFQSLVYQSLIKDEGYYEFQDLWKRVCARLPEHYERNKQWYRKSVLWARNADDIVRMIDQVIESDDGLPLLLSNYQCHQDRKMRLLRKLEVLSILTGTLDVDDATSKERLDNVQEACAYDTLSFKDLNSAYLLFHKFSERAIMRPLSDYMSVAESNDLISDYFLLNEPLSLRLTVRESDSGIFELAQWLVSLRYGDILHGLPALKQGVSAATYHNKNANGYYGFLQHDIVHRNKFMQFGFMWQKTFPREKYVCQYLLEGMWDRVKEFAHAGNSAKVLEVLVVYFFWIHESGKISLQSKSDEWVKSFKHVRIRIADPTYIALVSRLTKKKLNLLETGKQLSLWYAEHIMPVLEQIVHKKGYCYYGPEEGVKVEKEWGYNGYCISAEVCYKLMMSIAKIFFSKDQENFAKVLHAKLCDEKKYNCVLWPCPLIHIAHGISDGLIFIPSNKSLQNMSLGHLKFMLREY